MQHQWLFLAPGLLLPETSHHISPASKKPFVAMPATVHGGARLSLPFLVFVFLHRSAPWGRPRRLLGAGSRRIWGAEGIAWERDGPKRVIYRGSCQGGRARRRRSRWGAGRDRRRGSCAYWDISRRQRWRERVWRWRGRYRGSGGRG